MDLRKWNGGMNWIKLAQNRDGWRAGINAVLIFRVTYNAGDFLLAEHPLVSHEGLCSMSLVGLVWLVR